MSNSFVVNFAAYVQKLPTGYSIFVSEMADDRYMATIRNDGAGVHVSAIGSTPEIALERCYEKWRTTYRRQ